MTYSGDNKINMLLIKRKNLPTLAHYFLGMNDSF